MQSGGSEKNAGRGVGALRDAFSPIHFEPAIDGILIQESNFDAYKKNHHHKIPVLAGYNRGEAEGFSRAFGKTIDTVAGLDSGVCRRFWRKGGGIHENQPGGK